MSNFRVLVNIIACIACLLSLVTVSYAQDLNINETFNQVANQELSKIPPDPLKRRNPRGTVLGYLDAMASEDYKRASQYLDLSYIDKEKRVSQGPKIAKNLQIILDRSGTLYASALISNLNTGNKEDDLDINIDRIGTLTFDSQSVQILVEKLEDESGHPIWLISSQTLELLPEKVELGSILGLDQLLPSFFVENKLIGGAIGHWMAVVILLIISIITAWMLTLTVTLLTSNVLKKRSLDRHSNIVTAFLVPVRLWLTVWIFVFLARALGISILVRQYLSPVTIIIYWLAFLILLWQITNVVSVIIEEKMTKKRNFAALTGIDFCRRSIKFILIAAGIIIVLKLNGHDVTNWLAAIGIGGIAIALGAQKFIENIVGSVSLIADQPIRIGDFCKVDNCLGTIVQIGIRSTRIRTLNRTIVTIPNGEFSTHKIENYTKRDTFLFRTRLNLRYETTPDQIRYLLVELREIFYAHPKVNNNPYHSEPTRVRFIDFAADSLVIELYAQIITEDYDDYLQIREDISLRVMDVVSKSGTTFAFPSRTLYFGKDKGLSEEQRVEAESQVQQWRDDQELQIPTFSPKRVKELTDTIKYPPDDSANS